MNPKNGVWNKPKASTYSLAKVLFIDEKGHIQNAEINEYTTDESGQFLSEYESGLSDFHAGKLWIFKALHESQKQTSKSIYKGEKTEVWAKAYELLAEWGKSELIKKIRQG
jgi:hypothetical protein